MFADIGVLGTLPDRELRAGLMESVKAGIIRDRALVRFMEEHAEAMLGRDSKALERVIAASIRMKGTLLADDKKDVAKKFDVLKEKNMYGKKVMGIVRSTFLIGPDGKIVHIFSPVKPEGHAEEVLALVKKK